MVREQGPAPEEEISEEEREEERIATEKFDARLDDIDEGVKEIVECMQRIRESGHSNPVQRKVLQMGFEHLNGVVDKLYYGEETAKKHRQNRVY